MSTATPHTWRFYRAGGLDQVRFTTGADIANLKNLDPKLWVALSCPVKGLELDERTLALVDVDKDGRVRHPEILAAVDFAAAHLRSLDTLLKPGDGLPLSDINDATPEGRAALLAAKRILANLGKPDADRLVFDDIADINRIFVGTKFNGDGVVPPESADEPAVAEIIKDIIAIHGSTADLTHVPAPAGAAVKTVPLQGVDAARIDAFFGDLNKIEAWAAKGDLDPVVAPYGPATAPLFVAVKAVRAKVNDYFARCHIVAYDKRAITAEPGKDTPGLGADMAAFPIAPVAPGADLPLRSGVNPAWADAVEALRAALVPVLGDRTELPEASWREINKKLADHETWSGTRPASKLDPIKTARIREIVALGGEAKVRALLARDLQHAAESSGVAAVEKLVRLDRDFLTLLNNFVAFADFYNPNRLATFQAGRLYLDSRECHLCIRVEDTGKHAAMAGLSKCYLAYCDISRKTELAVEKAHILAVFSEGDSDYLMVGRNGVFVDRNGRDWDATITKIIDAPISIRQAFFSPYKKAVRFVEEQIAKRAAAADDEANARLADSAGKVANADKHAAPPPKKEERKIDLGTIALIGTTVTGLAAIVGGLLQAFFGLGWLMPLGLLGLVLAISGPSMLIAALKLRQRNLGPILDANGWAMNGRVKVNIPFGTSLTLAAELPKNSEQSLDDPFAEKRSPWPRILTVLAVLCAAIWGVWRSNIADDFIKKHLGENRVYKSPEVREKERLDREATEQALREAKAKADAQAELKKETTPPAAK